MQKLRLVNKINIIIFAKYFELINLAQNKKINNLLNQTIILTNLHKSSQC
jgi:hypothetical protein